MPGDRAMPCVDDSGAITGWMVMCPGCQCGHKFEGLEGRGWGFNGNKALPKFEMAGAIDGDTEHHRCYFKVDCGRITFSDDCSHPFRGMTVDLPAWN